MKLKRKFMLTGFPDIPAERVYLVKQSYLSTDPEIRIRETLSPEGYRVKFPYKMTIRGKNVFESDKVESEISKDFYNQLLAFIDKEPVRKTCNVYACGKHKITVSLIDNRFYCAEVEFSSAEEARLFSWPWAELLKRETTEETSSSLEEYWLSSRVCK